MGLEPFLAERIFTLIDKNNDEIVTFDDFVHYISILLNGSGLEKALWSFKMLSSIDKMFLIFKIINLIWKLMILKK